MLRRSLEATACDALVPDLGLPGVDGHDVLVDLREAGHRLPVLILAARDSLVERGNTLNEGVDGSRHCLTPCHDPALVA